MAIKKLGSINNPLPLREAVECDNCGTTICSPRSDKNIGDDGTGTLAILCEQCNKEGQL